MDGLVRDCDKLAKHQTVLNNKTLHAIDGLIKAMEEVRQTEESERQKQLVKLKSQVDKAQGQVNEQLKDLYTTVSKYGKHVEKAFKLDLTVVSASPAFADKQSVHFLREGDFSAASAFASEAQLDLPAHTQQQFSEMYATVAAMRTDPHDLTKALQWADAARGCRAGLIEMGQTTEALAYARTWFQRFASAEHMAEIQHLMGIFIYARDLRASPYADMFDSRRWEDGARLFARAFCAHLGLAAESPLGVAAGAGARALPVKRVEWSAQDELAVEVPLPENMRFHSVFACPVSKEQASSANPPMMMPCGHVVCRASLERLARGVRPGAVASGRFKCPYCPSMSTLGDAKRVYF
ncbi:hypothetical protein DL89DRAFT_270528 [Linderina pennispora]|uniref:GID complex catalytic subunit 2 n=1 Tax=Linderina pennispora TaxID=61395 RepID=A0A1Y1VX73_9FUNG|nr:ubiquitin-protein ligase RMD5 [Linderina pennispora]ORX65803.1 hypothetical protein DL89DRAFT_270528 [Linderina pennispora]